MIQLQATSGDALNTKSDVLLVILGPGKTFKSALLSKLGKIQMRNWTEDLTAEGFKASAGQTALQSGYHTKAKWILFAGLGEKKSLNLETLRNIGATFQSVCKSKNAKSATIALDDSLFTGWNLADCAQALGEGAHLGSYQYAKYKKEEPHSLKKITFIQAKKAKLSSVQSSVKKATLLAEGVFLARDLVNGPGGDVTPKFLADTAKKIKGIQVKVHGLTEIKKMKMGAYLSVGLGSTDNPPQFIEMHYKPKKKAKKKIALVGKGVTFDSGGYSLKPPKAQETMKMDMAGSAGVLGVMSIVSRLAPNVEVHAYVAATENMIDGSAQRPGDVCTARNGKTIEVLNTDAEGRLTMADALVYANEKNPDYIIDMATLTGACLVALGKDIAGLMTNDERLKNKVVECSEFAGEKVWQLPLPEEYREQIKSPIADIKNTGAGPYGGTITAGLFLQEFVGDTKWVHLDIAGPAWSDGAKGYRTRGGSGVMVRTLARLLEKI